MARDLIISGIPRGGTTLTTALIDSLPNAVCLNEPQWHSDWIWGVNTTATALMRDSVSAVSTTGTGFSLELSRGGSVGYTDVKAFN